MKKLLLLFGLFLTLNTFAAVDGVPLILKNNTLRSIPLEIPGVMNPNLSPLSYSGVELNVGQEVYFLHQGERYLLLEVSEKLANKKIKVAKLIKQRKKELDL